MGEGGKGGETGGDGRMEGVCEGKSPGGGGGMVSVVDKRIGVLDENSVVGGEEEGSFFWGGRGGG